jgi:hypothetical protein
MDKFPIKITALWRQVFPALMLGGVLGQGAAWWRGQSLSLPNSLPIMAFAAVIVVALHAFYPTLAGPNGLGLMNRWGLRRRVTWGDIFEVRLVRQYGMYPSLRIRCAHGGVYWIAMDSANLPQLYALALRHGGPDHPLAIALATPLYAL